MNITNEELIEFAKDQCEIFPEDSYMGKYLRESLKMLQAEPCEVAPDTNVRSKKQGEHCEDAVSRQAVFELAETIQTDDYSGNETIDVVTVDEILGVESADVVERSEYVESQKEVMRLRDLSHKGTQDAMHYEEMYRELHRKIDNAILALEREQNSEFWNSSFRDGVDYVLEFLKKNLGIGESEL